jgi:periplasmic protein TonB
MPDQMFHAIFVDAKQSRKPWLVVMSFAGQIFLVFLLVLIPLVYTDALPRAQLTSFLVAPPPPPPPAPPAPSTPKIVKLIPRHVNVDTLMAPRRIPTEIADIREDLTVPSSAAVPGSVPGVETSGVPGGALGIFDSAPAPTLAPPPVKVAKATTPRRIQVGGIVQQANLIRKVQPTYPALAKQARIQGAVHFTAIIGRDGSIQNLQLISGHPLLVEAARQAVSQWQYKATLLNGEAVEVVTQIEVNFTLTQ